MPKRYIEATEAIRVLSEYYHQTDSQKYILAEAISRVPTADVVGVVRCKDCKHMPTGTGANHDLEFPDDKCPCQCAGDYWYSWMPPDDWFCPCGKRKEGGADGQE